MAAKLLDTIENQTNTNNENKIIEVAETEINNMQQIKDGLDGCAYLIWGRREWNRAQNMENSGGLRTTYLVAKALYAGSESFCVKSDP